MFHARVLFSAVANGDVETLRQAEVEDLHVFDPMTGDTLVHIAVQKKQFVAAVEVARLAADVLGQRNMLGRTALLEAVTYGYTDVAAELARLGPVALFMRDFYGNSPLASTDFLDALPDDLWSYSTPLTGNSLMHEAAINGLIDLAERAVKKAPEMIRSMMADGMMPLHVAAFFGRVDIAKLFMREFPDAISYLTDRGKTPLFCAAELSPWKNNDIIRVLFEAAPEMILIRDHRGRTPIFEIARLGTADTMRMVLAHCPDAVLIPDRESGWTPLHVSLYGRYGVWSEVAKEIIRACPLSLFIKDNLGLTPLQHAHVTFDKRESDCGDFLSYVLRYMELPDVMWEHIPMPCEHISKALAAALGRSTAEASKVVRHMTRDDRARLHAALLIVTHAMTSHGVYSEDIIRRIVGLAFV